jgi:hypothetical protein
MDRIREWPVSIAIASGIGIFFIGRVLYREREVSTTTEPATTASVTDELLLQRRRKAIDPVAMVSNG